MPENNDSMKFWAIVELMGHRRVAGFVSEAQAFGTTMCRIDVPSPSGGIAATQLYGGSSIYCITPTTEEVARAFAQSHPNQVAPAAHWELLPAPQEDDEDDEHEDI